MKHLILTLPLFFLLVSCTSYGRAGAGLIGGGYADFPLGGGKYRIEASGNGYTHQQRVESIALKRAAELTLQKGYKYFWILDEQGNTTTSISAWTYGVNTVNRHSVQLTILLTEDSNAIDAQEMFDSQHL